MTVGSIPANTKLTVVASVNEGATLSYQWYSNNSNSNTGGTVISGATGASYTLLTTLPVGKYYYFCEVRATGGAKSIRTTAVTIIVNPANGDINITYPGGDEQILK